MEQPTAHSRIPRLLLVFTFLVVLIVGGIAVLAYLLEEYEESTTATSASEIINLSDRITPADCPDGNWIDTHLHLETDEAFDNLQSLMDEHAIGCSLAFVYINPNDPLDSLEILKEDYVGDLNRLLPFFFVTPQQPADANVENIENIVAQIPDFFYGHGELAFYRDPFKGSSLLEDNFQQVFKYSEDNQFFIMFHLRNADQGPELEEILKTYPEAKLLIHGPELISELPRLLATHPNLYYTLDAATLFAEIDDSGITTNFLLYSDGGSSSVVEALATRRNELLQDAYTRWLPVFAAAPDKIFWGTDASADWHFEPGIFKDIMSFSEDFMNMLPEEYREGYMWANAKRELFN